jgi:CHAD domain-containing protein
LAGAVRDAGRHPSDAQLHRVRIRAKEVRYASEASATLMGKPARQLARAAERLQGLLGDHHDAVAAEEWLRDEGSSPAVAFIAGRLSEQEHRRQRELREQWPKAWRQLDRPRLRRWLR